MLTQHQLKVDREYPHDATDADAREPAITEPPTNRLGAHAHPVCNFCHRPGMGIVALLSGVHKYERSG